MTYREMMQENGENLGWCKPLSFLNGRVFVTQAEGSITAMRLDGEDIPVTPENLTLVAKLVEPCYDDFDGWDDTHIIMQSDSKELSCCNCPWFDVCDAMDEDV